MRIYLISGDGSGAGKSTLARTLVNPVNVWSLARPIREDLAHRYPGYPWFSKNQDDKDTRVKETGLTIRDMLVAEGEGRCKVEPLYYARRLSDALVYSKTLSVGGALAVDDLRKLIELKHLRSRFPGEIIHFHVSGESTSEHQYDNAQLKTVADYVLSWGRHESV